MSWTKPARRALLAAAACVALAACAGGQTAPRGAVAQIPDAKTPLDQYGIEVAPHPEELALGVHAMGLSPTQSAALSAYVTRWRESGDEMITVQTPSPGSCGCDAQGMGRATLAALSALGVPPSLLRLGAYQAAGGGAPVVVVYNRFEASTADCSRHWSNLSSSFDNAVSAHFGCATTQNVAAMVADPRDLMRPAPTGPADDLRRSVVLDKYRQGVVTSSAKDIQASGTVSSAVN